MPKIISEYERERTHEAIVHHTRQLIIAKKGIRDVTVDDIARAVGIAKGSFYSYFKSKEECFYQVLETTVADVYQQIALIKQEKLSTKEKVEKFVREVYLTETRVDYYFNTTDVEALFRKLPPEYSKREANFIGDGLIADIMEMMGMERVHAEAFYKLLECIEFASVSAISEQAKEEVLDTLILSLAEYAGKHSTV